jgi:stage V sporulation protein G
VEITEVRIKLMTRRNDKLRAFCSITLDNAFVIRDLKIIEGSKGIFVAMPSRKLTDRCVKCGMKNHLRSKFCTECGNRLPPERALKDVQGRPKLHADIAHPINSAAREAMQKKILQAYTEEVEKSKLPGYKPVEIFDSPEEYDAETDA